MKIHPARLPLFVYATLRTDGKYSTVFSKYEFDETEAFTFGTLYFVPYKDDKEDIDITVALDPEGLQRITGQLLSFKNSDDYRALVESDDKEFNFSDQSTREKKDRVFIRTIITCHKPNGEYLLAWAYIYVSHDGRKPKVLVNQNTTDFGTQVEFRKIDRFEYKALFEQASSR